LKAFIVVNRQTRKILAEFETREEAEAFRDGLISARATGKSPLSIRSTLGDRNDREARAARRAEKGGHTAHHLDSPAGGGSAGLFVPGECVFGNGS
jgi:hypothetical protein